MSLDEKHKLNIFVSENYDYINTNYSDRNINYLKNDISQYQIKGKIGEGMFGKVKLGIHLLTKEKVAIKIFDKRKIKNEKEKEYIKREISILKKLNHYNTIKLYNIIENENFIFLIQEYIPNGELLNFLEKTENLTEIYICKIYQQIISGIEYLYEIGIAHRDLKLENILLNYNKDIKIIDFGLSNKYNKENEELLQSSCGSPCYAAPEMIKGSKYHGVDTDIWSSGIILYLMLCKSFPFNDKNNSKLYQKILGGKFSLPNYLSNDVKDLLSKLLKVNPNERIKLNEIKKHPWFNLINQKKNYFFGIDTNKIIMPIDEDIIKYMKLFYGIDHNLIIDNILKNYENNITTIYNLLLQKEIRQGKKSIADFYSELYLEYINDEKNKLSYYNNDIELIIKNRINNINKKNKNIKNNFNFRKINPKVLKTKKNFNFYYNNQLKNISLNFSIKSHTIDNNNTSKSNSKKKNYINLQI
jgi:5'-AMP-activated protein kinase catalytic alpha subunit